MKTKLSKHYLWQRYSLSQITSKEKSY